MKIKDPYYEHKDPYWNVLGNTYYVGCRACQEEVAAGTLHRAWDKFANLYPDCEEQKTGD